MVAPFVVVGQKQMEVVPIWIWFVGVVGAIVVPGGSAWAAVKVSLNGMRGEVKRIDKAVTRLADEVTETREEVAFIKGRMDR